MHSQISGKLAAWATLAVLFQFATAWTLSAQEASQLGEQDIFDRTKLLEVQVEISDEDWDKLRSQSRSFAYALTKPAPPSPFSYFKADVTINGKRVESVGIRKKGFIGSLSEERPSLKIKFDEYVDQSPIAGLDRLTLNNNHQDATILSQLLAYKIFADAGLPASRCTLAHVTVNGESLGIVVEGQTVEPSDRRLIDVFVKLDLQGWTLFGQRTNKTFLTDPHGLNSLAINRHVCLEVRKRTWRSGLRQRISKATTLGTQLVPIFVGDFNLYLQ